MAADRPPPTATADTHPPSPPPPPTPHPFDPVTPQPFTPQPYTPRPLTPSPTPSPPPASPPPSAPQPTNPPTTPPSSAQPPSPRKSEPHLQSSPPDKPPSSPQSPDPPQPAQKPVVTEAPPDPASAPAPASNPDPSPDPDPDPTSASPQPPPDIDQPKPEPPALRSTTQAHDLDSIFDAAAKLDPPQDPPSDVQRDDDPLHEVPLEPDNDGEEEEDDGNDSDDRAKDPDANPEPEDVDDDGDRDGDGDGEGDGARDEDGDGGGDDTPAVLTPPQSRRVTRQSSPEGMPGRRRTRSQTISPMRLRRRRSEPPPRPPQQQEKKKVKKKRVKPPVVGDRVRVLWHVDEIYYPGTIDNVLSFRGRRYYDVTYDSQEREYYLDFSVRKWHYEQAAENDEDPADQDRQDEEDSDSMDEDDYPRKGDNIMVMWHVDRLYYPGKITDVLRVGKKLFHDISYEKGDLEFFIDLRVRKWKFADTDAAAGPSKNQKQPASSQTKDKAKESQKRRTGSKRRLTKLDWSNPSLSADSRPSSAAKQSVSSRRSRSSAEKSPMVDPEQLLRSKKRKSLPARPNEWRTLGLTPPQSPTSPKFPELAASPPSPSSPPSPMSPLPPIEPIKSSVPAGDKVEESGLDVMDDNDNPLQPASSSERRKRPRGADINSITADLVERKRLKARAEAERQGDAQVGKEEEDEIVPVFGPDEAKQSASQKRSSLRTDRGDAPQRGDQEQGTGAQPTSEQRVSVSGHDVGPSGGRAGEGDPEQHSDVAVETPDRPLRQPAEAESVDDGPPLSVKRGSGQAGSPTGSASLKRRVLATWTSEKIPATAPGREDWKATQSAVPHHVSGLHGIPVRSSSVPPKRQQNMHQAAYRPEGQVTAEFVEPVRTSRGVKRARAIDAVEERPRPETGVSDIVLVAGKVAKKWAVEESAAIADGIDVLEKQVAGLRKIESAAKKICRQRKASAARERQAQANRIGNYMTTVDISNAVDLDTHLGDLKVQIVDLLQRYRLAVEDREKNLKRQFETIRHETSVQTAMLKDSVIAAKSADPPRLRALREARSELKPLSHGVPADNSSKRTHTLPVLPPATVAAEKVTVPATEEMKTRLADATSQSKYLAAEVKRLQGREKELLLDRDRTMAQLTRMKYGLDDSGAEKTAPASLAREAALAGQKDSREAQKPTRSKPVPAKSVALAARESRPKPQILQLPKPSSSKPVGIKKKTGVKAGSKPPVRHSGRANRKNVAKTGSKYVAPAVAPAAPSVPQKAEQTRRKSAGNPKAADTDATLPSVAEQEKVSKNFPAQLGKQMDKQAAELLALVVSVWLLQDEGRTEPPKNPGEKQDKWVLGCVKGALRHSYSYLNSCSGIMSAKRTLLEDVDGEDVETSWIFSNTEDGVEVARSNYSLWDPALRDEEWLVERRVLRTLTTCIRAAMALTTAGRFSATIMYAKEIARKALADVDSLLTKIGDPKKLAPTAAKEQNLTNATDISSVEKSAGGKEAVSSAGKGTENVTKPANQSQGPAASTDPEPQNAPSTKVPAAGQPAPTSKVISKSGDAAQVTPNPVMEKPKEVEGKRSEIKGSSGIAVNKPTFPSDPTTSVQPAPTTKPAVGADPPVSKAASEQPEPTTAPLKPTTDPEGSLPNITGNDSCPDTDVSRIAGSGVIPPTTTARDSKVKTLQSRTQSSPQGGVQSLQASERATVAKVAALPSNSPSAPGASGSDKNSSKPSATELTPNPNPVEVSKSTPKVPSMQAQHAFDASVPTEAKMLPGKEVAASAPAIGAAPPAVTAAQERSSRTELTQTSAGDEIVSTQAPQAPRPKEATRAPQAATSQSANRVGAPDSKPAPSLANGVPTPGRPERSRRTASGGRKAKAPSAPPKRASRAQGTKPSPGAALSANVVVGSKNGGERTGPNTPHPTNAVPQGTQGAAQSSLGVPEVSLQFEELPQLRPPKAVRNRVYRTKGTAQAPGSTGTGLDNAAGQQGITETLFRSTPQSAHQEFPAGQVDYQVEANQGSSLKPVGFNAVGLKGLAVRGLDGGDATDYSPSKIMSTPSRSGALRTPTASKPNHVQVEARGLFGTASGSPPKTRRSAQNNTPGLQTKKAVGYKSIPQNPRLRQGAATAPFQPRGGSEYVGFDRQQAPHQSSAPFDYGGPAGTQDLNISGHGGQDRSRDAEVAAANVFSTNDGPYGDFMNPPTPSSFPGLADYIPISDGAVGLKRLPNEERESLPATPSDFPTDRGFPGAVSSPMNFDRTGYSSSVDPFGTGNRPVSGNQSAGMFHQHAAGSSGLNHLMNPQQRQEQQKTQQAMQTPQNMVHMPQQGQLGRNDPFGGGQGGFATLQQARGSVFHMRGPYQRGGQ